VVFIVGDATARVGDPSGRNKTRPMLSDSEILKNAETYQSQAFKILNPKQTEVVFNNSWFSKMKIDEIMSLASRVTVGQITQRDDFQKRLKAGIPVSLLELFYPLMQAYDSVVVKADVEMGGTDQKFNLLMGRELQKEFNILPQVVHTMPLLVGLDGTEKMSKSLGNHVGITDAPNDMFGKLMSISDDLMWDYYTMLLGVSGERIKKAGENGKKKKKKAKEDLAVSLVAKFHSSEDAEAALSNFNQVFVSGENPEDMPVYSLPDDGITLLKLLTESDLVASGKEARRLIAQNAVSINKIPCSDPQRTFHPDRGSESIIKLGKRKFLRLI
ncbi:MAG: tyrosine--tRNA ligase, partial [Candidatus Omnitrophica bacterium]|nr:tyrosine--tRNA ligase [Candidatus Omnitrophota bacterium]